MNRIATVWLTAFTALAVIVVEILYTRLFSAIYFSSFAFLIISLALFGTGLSGLQYSLSGKRSRNNAAPYLLWFAVSLPAVLKLTLTIKVDFLNLFSSPVNILFLLINFSALILPFFLGGAVLVRIFALNAGKIGKLYFYDLAGAALGSLLVIPLITAAGPMRSMLMISIVLLVTWYFLPGRDRGQRLAILVLLLPVLGAGIFFSGDIFSFTPKIEKRDYVDDLRKGRIEYSRWSPINKIDVAPFILNRQKKVVWLNCGTQQTWFVRIPADEVSRKKIKWTHASIPYQLGKKGSALIIGSAGGHEVQCALANGFKRIFAVEMDPELCSLVSGKYSDYIGDVFKREGVFLINDEGRSVLKRLNKKFNVIQMVNSHPRDTLLSGGLSISETYIYTVPAFMEYWKNLEDGGFLSIVHVYGERMFSTAFEALRKLKVREPEKKFFVIQIPDGFNYFFMKKGNIDAVDLKTLLRFSGKNEIVYSPFSEKNNIYHDLASADYKEVIRRSAVNISPAGDNSPYFNQPNRIGQFRFSNNLTRGMANEKVERVLVYTNSVYISVFFAAFFFSLLFIYFPLRKREGAAEMSHIAFFSMIGLAFIMVEIILIKIFQLLLGNPSYSISVIIFSLLISAGTGSYFSERILRLFGGKMIHVSVFLSLLLVLYAFLLFPVIYGLISLPLVLRAFIALALISIPGTLMGIFFPVGIRKVSLKGYTMVGWAWGANAFATVLGSVVTVILSINWNFTIALISAAVIYLAAGFLFPQKD